MFSVMIQKIGDPVKCHRSLATSCCPLNNHDPVMRIADDGILLLLDGTDDIFQLYFSVASKLCLQDFIVDLYITFKFVDQISLTDLVLPLGSDLSFKNSGRCFIRSRTSVIIIKKSADRCSPVIYQRSAPCFLGKISNTDIKSLRLLISFIKKIYSSKGESSILRKRLRRRNCSSLAFTCRCSACLLSKSSYPY